jgi:hypothetical protein
MQERDSSFNYRVLTEGKKRSDMFLVARKLIIRLSVFTFTTGFMFGVYIGTQLHS